MLRHHGSLDLGQSAGDEELEGDCGAGHCQGQFLKLMETWGWKGYLRVKLLKKLGVGGENQSVCAKALQPGACSRAQAEPCLC